MSRTLGMLEKVFVFRCSDAQEELGGTYAARDNGKTDRSDEKLTR